MTIPHRIAEKEKAAEKAAGMNGHIAKPIDVAKLIGMLDELLK